MLALENPYPVIVTEIPAGPEAGSIEYMEGAGDAGRLSSWASAGFAKQRAKATASDVADSAS